MVSHSHELLKHLQRFPEPLNALIVVQTVIMGKSNLTVVQKTLTCSTMRGSHTRTLLKNMALYRHLYWSILIESYTSNRADCSVERIMKWRSWLWLHVLQRLYSLCQTTLKPDIMSETSWANDIKNWTVAQWSKINIASYLEEEVWGSTKSRLQYLRFVICWCWSTACTLARFMFLLAHTLYRDTHLIF